MTVCFEIDNYINDKDKSHWFVDLSDGRRVYGDDDRPGLEPNSWFRLREFLYSNNLTIVRLYIRFRSHIELIGSSDKGYFFRKGILASVADGSNYHRFICGTINEQDKINIQVWNVPELIKDDSESEERSIEGVEESIIWNSPVSLVKSVPQVTTLPNSCVLDTL